MFISKKHIPRRSFLKGAGVTLALPLLDAMVPAATVLAQTAAVPKPRFAGIFFPHGMAPGYWVPEAEGTLPAECKGSSSARRVSETGGRAGVRPLFLQDDRLADAELSRAA